jgi:hypothetical protein
MAFGTADNRPFREGRQSDSKKTLSFGGQQRRVAEEESPPVIVPPY